MGKTVKMYTNRMNTHPSMPPKKMSDMMTVRDIVLHNNN